MNDAQFWKAELWRELARIRERIAEEGVERLTARSAQLERFAFVTAYIMRKLEEGDALTQEVMKSKWPVTVFACTSPPPGRSWFRISHDRETWRQPLENHYDLNAPGADRLVFQGVCNGLIHHFAFAVRRQAESDNMEILFNSNQTKNKRLYAMALDAYMALVEEVHYDEIRWVDMDRDANRIIQRRQRPPDG
jgi:hypothetical protein